MLLMPTTSVIVRCRDKQNTIEATFAALRRQSVGVQIVVVDSGSRDGTLDIARRWCDELVQLEPERFSYGRALNVGAEAAAGSVLFALSAHCAPASAEWVERSLAHYADSSVAATSGYAVPPPGARPGELVLQDHARLRADPFCGMSNHASSWRRDVWERFAFDEQLEACEDREWSWRVTAAGYVIAMDPALQVVSRHRVADGPRAYFERNVREARGVAAFAPRHYGVPDAIAEWWHTSPPAGRSRTQLLLSPWHVTALAAKWWGSRCARKSIA